MKDYRIAYVTSGHSDYDAEVRELLSKRHAYQRCFTEFDHLDLADCFVLAGADIKSSMAEMDEALADLWEGGDKVVQLEIFIDVEDKAGFLTRLSSLIEAKYACLKGRRD